ncbi:hypothetical protein FHL15_006436 [Xylaria flabelliformis]|uniref:Uncharacterized protein n=1 Tax=Xylaria flabelliformis TaxID=2512241 RepID=A0A553HXU8_9PEZI|nr:hypothetical protein FHL15_006436 [Xylaria flabelliformis]
MSILCCCRNRQLAEKETKPEAIELPSQPPRARLSKTLSRSDTDMFLSSILASRGPSQLITPAYHNIVDPEAVEADDSDEDGPERNTQGPNIGTLGSLRTKLIRRLSHRGATKPGSRPSIGTTNEELARRAELKRLMHKRIQEELKSEEEEDDLRLAPPERPSINNCREPELSGGGPRDTIEFSVSSVDEQETKKEANTLSETSIFSSPVVRELNGAQEPCPQLISCSDPLRRSTSNSDHGRNDSFNDIESVIRPPSPPHLTPVHLLGGSGRESPSTASWRLSYSAIHIESYIEPLVDIRQVSRPQSPEPGDLSTRREDDTTQPQEADTTTDFSNPTMQDETIDTSQTMQFEHPAYPEIRHKENDISGRYSPLDVWLRSQDLHCASILSSRSNSEIALDRLHEPSIREVKDLQKSAESADMSSHKDQTADSSSILQDHARGAWPETLRHIVHEGKLSLDTPNDESIALSRVLNQMENTLHLENSTTENLTQDISSHYTSSRYTTRPNSRQATPRDSRASLTGMLGNRKVMQPLLSTYDISSYRTALNKTPSLDHPKPKPDVSQLPMAEALPNNASETASFRQREEELKSIQKRFGLTPVRLSPMGPVRSKFREEFEDPKSLNSGRGSILSKLHLALPKRAGASSSHTESNKSYEETGLRSTQLPKPKIFHSSGLDPNTGRLLSSNMEQCVIGLQQHAAKQEAEPRHWRWKAKIIKVSMLKRTINETGPRPVSASSHRHGIIATHSVDQEKKCPDNSSSPPFKTSNERKIPDEVETSGAIDIHAGVLQEWVEQLQAEDMQRQSRTESRANVPKRQPRRLRTPPDSWAKWPSHTREKRTAPAGEKDKVNSWDFALVMNSNSSEIGVEGKLPPRGREITATSQTLSSQVSKALKSGWNKMVTHTGSFGRASEPGITIQHTAEPRGFLEYPELELQPTAEGYREVQALDQQIGTMKRRSTSGGRDMRKSSSDGARRPLASRIAEEVHKFQTEDRNTAWADIDHRTRVLPGAQFLSPAHALLTHGSKSCDPELTNAPGSQCTYEDCVQTQMLHDDGDKSPERITIKRAKSTGNIETKLSGDTLPVNKATSNHCGPAHKTGISGLRRHQSLGWLRGRSPSSEGNQATATKQE